MKRHAPALASRSLELRFVLVTVAIVAVALAAVTATHVWDMDRHRHEDATTELELGARVRADILGEDLGELSADLRLFGAQASGVDELSTLLGIPGASSEMIAQAEARVAATLLQWASYRPSFLHVRLLNSSGEAIVQIDRTDGVPTRVPADLSGSVGARIPGIVASLAPGDVFLSVVERGHDHLEHGGAVHRHEVGMMEHPPVMVVGMVLGDAGGPPTGSIVLNVDAGELLDPFEESSTTEYHLMDQDGAYIYHRNPELMQPGSRGFGDIYGAEAHLSVIRGPTVVDVDHALLAATPVEMGDVQSSGQWYVTAMLPMDGTHVSLTRPVAVAFAFLVVAAVLAFALASRVSRSLRAASSELAGTLQATPDAIVLADQDGIIVGSNEAAELLFGWPPGQLAGRDITVLMPRQLAGKHGSILGGYLERTARAGQPVMREIREANGMRRDGSEFPMEIMVAEVGEVEGGGRKFVAAIRDVTYRKEAERERLGLVQQLLTAQEHERQQVAFEIHDGPAQQLAGADMLLETYVAKRNGDGDPLTERHLQSARRHLNEALEETRRIMTDLRPAMLDDLGLIEALRTSFRERERQTGIAIEFLALDDDRLRRGDAADVTVFRVATEAVSNAIRHSGTSRIAVLLSVSGSDVELSVRDWGRGFDPEEAMRARQAGHLGVVAMRERASLLGGSLTIERADGGGALVTLRVPLSAWGDQDAGAGRGETVGYA